MTMFELRLEQWEGARLVKIWLKFFPGKGCSKYKGAEVETSVARSEDRKAASGWRRVSEGKTQRK